MAKNSYSNRTTLWDDGGPAETPAPDASPARGAWRAPSAVLSDRRPVAGMPPVPRGIDDDEPIPRRSKNYAPRSYWWRPRSTFGRVLLGMAVVLTLSAVVVAGIVVRQFLVRDPHFRIPGASSIASTGLSEVNRADVLPVFGEDIGRNIFFVPLQERRRQLETIPWVKQATVMRFLPDRLSVSIVERTPVAFVRQGQTVELADADGVILTMPPSMLAQHHYSFPVVTGINPKDSPAARRTRMAVYQRFVAELDQNQQHLSEQVSEIDLADPEDLRAWMPEQGADILAHFGEDQFLRRLQVYKAHIAEWRQRYPRLIGVDLRYNGEVPLEMAVTGAGGDSAADSGKVAAAATTAAKPAAKPVAKPVAKTEPEQQAAVKTAADQEMPKSKAPVSTAAARKAAEARKKAARLKSARAQAATHKPTSSGRAAVRP